MAGADGGDFECRFRRLGEGRDGRQKQDSGGAHEERDDGAAEFVPEVFSEGGKLLPMPDVPQSNPDDRLDQLSKIANILLPLVVALVGGLYTYEKDKNDERTLAREQKRDLQQVQYGNLTALNPLLTSQDPASRTLGMEIFTSEAKKHEAPLDLVPSIKRLGVEHPENQAQAQAAVAAATGQSNAQKTGSQ
jgi:hypothetical protein